MIFGLLLHLCKWRNMIIAWGFNALILRYWSFCKLLEVTTHSNFINTLFLDVIFSFLDNTLYRWTEFASILISFAIWNMLLVLRLTIESTVTFFQSNRWVTEILSYLLSLFWWHVLGSIFLFHFFIIRLKCEWIGICFWNLLTHFK